MMPPGGWGRIGAIEHLSAASPPPLCAAVSPFWPSRRPTYPHVPRCRWCFLPFSPLPCPPPAQEALPRRCRGCLRGLRIVARCRQCALRQLALEGRAPGFGIGARTIALVAHVIEPRAQLGHQLIGAVALCCRRVTLLARLLGIGQGNGRVNPVQLGRIDLPLAVFVPGGGNLAGLDRAQDRRLVEAGRRCGGAEGVVHGVRLVSGAIAEQCCALWLMNC